MALSIGMAGGYTGTLPAYPAAGVGSNITTAGQLGDLAQQITNMNISGQTAANAARIPNATGLETQSSNMIGQELSGQVPADVIQQLQKSAAERGISVGTGDSPNTNASYLQALGLTSIGQQQTGQSNLSAAEARNPAAPIYDPSQVVESPAQAQQAAAAQQGLSQQQEQINLDAQKQAQQYALQLAQWQNYLQQQQQEQTLRGTNQISNIMYGPSGRPTLPGTAFEPWQGAGF